MLRKRQCLSLWPQEVIPQVGTIYIFFVKRGDFYSSDPFHIIKLLPATDDNIARITKLISK